MPTRQTIDRRNFLRGAAASAIGVAVGPTIIPGAALGKDGSVAPSNRVVLGHIGVGAQGGGLLRGFLQLDESQSIALCDPFKDRRESKAQMVEKHYANKDQKGSYKGCKPYNDFRELLARDDIDAVVIATPDHWHVPIAMAAVRAGKDIYVEKPLGISLEQDKALRKAVHSHDRVFQYGTQQRGFDTHCGFACELVRNGYIGELKAIHVVAPNGASGGTADPQPVPEGFDYDLWLGPAAETPYTDDRVKGLGRWMIYDYALGFIAGWGAHPLDIAHWGYPHLPVEYSGTGKIPTEGLFNTIVDWKVQGRYASGVEFSLTTGPDKTTFVGTEGWVAPSRGGLTTGPDSLRRIKLKPDETHLVQSNHHYRNFVKCVLDRSTPVSDIDSAVQSDAMSHLSDIAIRTGRTIKWDPKKETIIGDPQAGAMLTRAMRAPWGL